MQVLVSCLSYGRSSTRKSHIVFLQVHEVLQVLVVVVEGDFVESHLRGKRDCLVELLCHQVVVVLDQSLRVQRRGVLEGVEHSVVVEVLVEQVEFLQHRLDFVP